MATILVHIFAFLEGTAPPLILWHNLWYLEGKGAYLLQIRV
jgi:hypothetical protein